MIIETNYNIGDEVYYQGTNNIIKDTISNIKVDIDDEKNKTITYEVWDGGITLNENELFSTEEELLECLNRYGYAKCY